MICPVIWIGNKVKVTEIKTDLMHTIDVESEESDVTSNSNGFGALSDDDKSNVEMVLFLLHKFCVGDSFYHKIIFGQTKEKSVE